jgi:hypothetical protein
MGNAEKVLSVKRKGERSPERLRGGEAVALGFEAPFYSVRLERPMRTTKTSVRTHAEMSTEFHTNASPNRHGYVHLIGRRHFLLRDGNFNFAVCTKNNNRFIIWHHAIWT